MRRNKRWTVDEKVGIVQKYLEEGISFARLAKEYECSDRLISSWVSRYKEEGTDGLRRKRVKQNYSEEFKLMLIGEVENGQSQAEVTKKYHLSSDALLSSWIQRYTRDNRSTSKGRLLVANGRKTTLEERLEIVSFALTHKKDYQTAADQYRVSYQQVYSWVRKYELEGEEGLVDRRGTKRKSVEEMSEVERLENELKEAKRNNRQLQMENDYLKKLKEIEQKLRGYR
jgi:transposase-like protein